MQNLDSVHDLNNSINPNETYIIKGNDLIDCIDQITKMAMKEGIRSAIKGMQNPQGVWDNLLNQSGQSN